MIWRAWPSGPALALAVVVALTACGRPARKAETPPPPAQEAIPAETLPGRVPVYAGTYSGTLPAGADVSAREVTLALRADMSATLTTASPGQGQPTVERGTWSFHGEEVTFQPAAAGTSGAPMPLIWNIQDNHRLVPRAWNHALYGSVGVPMEKRP